MGVLEQDNLQESLDSPMGTAEMVGRSFPLGATLVAGGVNFTLFSRGASGVELLLFDREDDARPSRILPIDPAHNRSYHYWHVFVPGIAAGPDLRISSAWTFDPARGLRFDPSKILLDPYGRAVVVPRAYDRKAAGTRGDNTADRHEERGRGSAMRTTGKATCLEAAHLAHRSSTRCTCAASPLTPTPALPRTSAARTPD